VLTLLESSTALRPWSEEKRRKWLLRFEKDPAGGRLWLSQHPAHLMLLTGWGVERHHMEGFNHFLLNQRSLWLAPRGSGKSTVAVYLAAWLAIADLHSRHPTNESAAEEARWQERQALYSLMFGSATRRVDSRNIRIALTSSSHPNAKRLLWQVKHLLLKDAVTRCLGTAVHDEKRDRRARWTDEMADSGYRDSSLREPTWTALGLGSKVAGGHYDVVLGDDWVTLDNARTPVQREHVSDFWGFTVKGTCEPWARVGIYGTRYHPKDWYGQIVSWSEGGSDSEGTWALLRHPAVIKLPNGGRRSYWPAVFSLEELDKIRAEIGGAAFGTQYQNETRVMEGGFFERQWLEQFVAWAELPRDVRAMARTGIALDMAFKGGPKNDWSVFTLGHMISPCEQFKHGRFHLEKARRGKWTKRELIKQGEALYLEAKKAGCAPMVFAIEAAPGVEFLVQDFKQSDVIPRGIVKAMPPRINKMARAEKARTLFEIGVGWFDPPTALNQIQEVIDEMLSFTGDRTNVDDCVDSLVWLIIDLLRGRTRLRRRNRL
jgi:phage terminase large subunit-like protein